MADVLNFGLTWKDAQANNLFELVNDSSTFLKIELNRVANTTGQIENVRGMGTYIGFDVNGGRTDNMIRWL
jgi:4-aminobutyrate aminotransferase-like enzyme